MSSTTVGIGDDWKTSAWAGTLRGVAVFNAALWATTCLPLLERGGFVHIQIVLSGIYVAVCAFRSWLPRIDLERYCLHDTFWSSPVVGRSAATLAETAFAAQLALCLHRLGAWAELSWVQTAAYWLVPMLTLAQVCCWYSVLTLNHLGHAIENSLWTAAVALVAGCLFAATGHLAGDRLTLAWGGAVLATTFVLFMVLVDVPMYLGRWRRSQRAGARYLGLREGFRDALHRRELTRDWSIWKPEVAWLTGYFSVAVWLSMALVHLVRV